MSGEASHEYFARRREECLEKARTTTDPAIAKLHREFASHYERALMLDQTPTQQLA